MADICKIANTRRDPPPARRRWRSKPWVAEAARAVSSVSNPQDRHELHQPKASGRSASIDSPAVRSSDHDATLRAAIERVVISRTTIEIELAEGMASDDQNRVLIIPWTPPSPHRRREIIQGEGDSPCAMGPMRTEARALLTDVLRDAHHWLDELSTNPHLTIESLAAREGKTERWIRRTLSLAFLSPALVKAAIDGRLPRGFGVKRLMDLPMVGLTSGRRSGRSRPSMWCNFRV